MTGAGEIYSACRPARCYAPASPFLPGILRLLYAYFNELPRDEAPFLKIPLHRVMKLRVDQSGCSESVIELGELADQDRDVPSC